MKGCQAKSSCVRQGRTWGPGFQVEELRRNAQPSSTPMRDARTARCYPDRAGARRLAGRKDVRGSAFNPSGCAGSVAPRGTGLKGEGSRLPGCAALAPFPHIQDFLPCGPHLFVSFHHSGERFRAVQVHTSGVCVQDAQHMRRDRSGKAFILVFCLHSTSALGLGHYPIIRVSRRPQRHAGRARSVRVRTCAGRVLHCSTVQRSAG